MFVTASASDTVALRRERVVDSGSCSGLLTVTLQLTSRARTVVSSSLQTELFMLYMALAYSGLDGGVGLNLGLN